MSELTQLYDIADRGHAEHRRRPIDWRPGPIVMRKVPNQPAAWEGVVTHGAYRIIAKIDGVWVPHEPHHRFEMGGNVEAHVPRAEAVELLVDRRPTRRPRTP